MPARKASNSDPALSLSTLICVWQFEDFSSFTKPSNSCSSIFFVHCQYFDCIETCCACLLVRMNSEENRNVTITLFKLRKRQVAALVPVRRDSTGNETSNSGREEASTVWRRTCVWFAIVSSAIVIVKGHSWKSIRVSVYNMIELRFEEKPAP